MADASVNGRRRLLTIAALATLELLAIIIVYQVMASIECRLTEMELACRALRSMTARGLAVLTALALFFWLRRTSFHRLAGLVAVWPGAPGWWVLHVVGLALIFLPLPLFGPETINARFLPSLLMMGIGGLCAALGALLATARHGAWTEWLRGDGFLLPLVLAGALLVPDLADSLRLLWYLQALTDVTFALVYVVLLSTGAEVWADLSIHVIGMDGFNVQVGSPCSGVEGIALISIFMALYALLMRGEVRQARFWLVLYPLALLTSWTLNVLRIAVLIMIGAWVSPEHALNGFHSYAGWLLFTLLAIGVLAVAHRWRWLHRDSAAPQVSPPLSRDPIVARIAPFVVMMISGLVAQAFWQEPDAGYPLRVAMMVAVLIWCLPALRQIPWKFDGIALLAGLAIGIGWIVTAPTGLVRSEQEFGWILIRVFGTVALIPLIEELFFRGYLLDRLDRGGLASRVTALALSSIAFGLLHDRFIAASLSGLVFGLVMLRTSRLASPIQAHVASNAIVAAWAAATMTWTLI